MKRFHIALLVICLGCLAFLNGAVWGKQVEAATSQAGVAATDNQVEKSLGSGSWQSCQVGDVLRAGDKIRTGKESSASLLLADHSMMRLASNTELKIVDLTEQENGCLVRRFQLSVGRVFSDVTPAGKGNPSVYEVKGPNAVAAVHGTAFEMDATDQGADTDVQVWDGTVACRGAQEGAKEEMVGANSSLRINQAGAFQRFQFTRQHADVWQEENLRTRDRWRSMSNRMGRRLAFEPNTFKTFQQARFRMTPQQRQAHRQKWQNFMRTHPLRPQGGPRRINPGSPYRERRPGALRPNRPGGRPLPDRTRNRAQDKDRP